MNQQPWRKIRRIRKITSKWVNVYADELVDNDGNHLEYWHVDRADSAIVVVRQGSEFVLPEPQYRPGVGKATLDFAGGRITDDETPTQAAARLVKKELGTNPPVLKPVNSQPLLVDSSFSNQKVYGFVTELPADASPKGERLTAEQLLGQLECMQCRSILLELLRTRR